MQGVWEWLALAAVGLVLVAAIYVYNRLVFNRARVAEAWSGIDVQLKRRANLIPNLLVCLKAYMAHERGTLEALARLRGTVQAHEANGALERGNAEGQLSAALTQVFVLVEGYPELKADAAFVDLQNNLVDTEEQIQMARRYYNGAVRELNVLVESVPSNLVAQAFAFHSAAYFSLDDRSQAQAPKLEL